MHGKIEQVRLLFGQMSNNLFDLIGHPYWCQEEGMLMVDS
jgi:hypothetical protein